MKIITLYKIIVSDKYNILQDDETDEQYQETKRHAREYLKNTWLGLVALGYKLSFREWVNDLTIDNN